MQGYCGIKLSNYGDTLKLIFPNYIRNNISGWINNSGKEIIYKIYENIMGNRVSKSDLINKSVKEQRVYGSYYIIY